eukprot:1146063-Pelagomonas_calceolata.AAC.7
MPKQSLPTAITSWVPLFTCACVAANGVHYDAKTKLYHMFYQHHRTSSQVGSASLLCEDELWESYVGPYEMGRGRVQVSWLVVFTKLVLAMDPTVELGSELGACCERGSGALEPSATRVGPYP